MYAGSAFGMAQVFGGLMVVGFLAHIGFPDGSRISGIARVVMVVGFLAAIVAGALALNEGCECGGG